MTTRTSLADPGAVSSPAPSELAKQFAELERRYVDALSRIRENESIAEWRRLTIASWAFAGSVCVAAIVVVMAVVRPEAARRVAAVEAELAGRSSELVAERRRNDEAEHRARALKAQLAEQEQQVADLEEELEAARAAAARKERPRPPPSVAAEAPPPATVPVPPPPAPPPAGPLATNCPPHSLDPLCGLDR